jgi:hypothetical protein
VTRQGFLAIWCDIGAEDLEDYRNWLTREHIADRTFLPGFRGVRLFEAPEAATSHFILYATEGPEVLESPAYRAVLDNPSPWTRRIMPRFGPFDRAAGVEVLKLGNGYGAHLAVCRIWTGAATPDEGRLRRALGRYLDLPGVVSLRLGAVDRGRTDIGSQEKTMRQGTEGAFQFLLCVEATSDAAARGAAAALAASVAEVFPDHDKSDLSCRRMIYGEAPHEAPTEG